MNTQTASLCDFLFLSFLIHVVDLVLPTFVSYFLLLLNNIVLQFINGLNWHRCRKGSRLGHDSLVDGMLKDGLTDVYNDCGMGVCAEICAENHKITREDQVCFHFSFYVNNIASTNIF